MTSATVFPDTTILIQYDALDCIDWHRLFGIDSVKLVLAPSVLQELDDIKNQDISSNLAQRAVETLESIERLKNGTLPAGQVSGVLMPEEPAIDFFAENLDYTSVADLLVASIIDYQSNFALDYIILLTEDKQTKIKALAAGIEVFSLPDKYRLDLSGTPKPQKSHPITSSLTPHNTFPISDKLSKPTTLFKQRSEEESAPESIQPTFKDPSPVTNNGMDHSPNSNESTPLLTLSDIGLNGLNSLPKEPEPPVKEPAKPLAPPIINIIQEPARPDTHHLSPRKKKELSEANKPPVPNTAVPNSQEETDSSSPNAMPSSFSFVSQSPPNPPHSTDSQEPVLPDYAFEKPDIRLSVGTDDESLTAVIIHHPVYPSLDDVNKHLTSVRSNFPKLQLPYEAGGDGVGGELISEDMSYGSIAPDTILQRKVQRIKKYNNALDAYYSGIEKYLSDNAEFENFKRRSAQLNLTLFNDLPDSLKSLYISVHFPGNVRVYYEDNLPERPSSPPPPEEPDLDMLFDPIRLPFVPVPNELSAGSDLKMRGRNPAPMEVRWNKGWDVIYSIREVEKNSRIPFNPLYITFNSFDHATSFRINYRITVASASYEQLGELEVIVRKEI